MIVNKFNAMPNLLKIKEIAEAQGISIRALADAIGVKENQIHVMVRTNSTKIETLEKIANTLHVPVAVFFNERIDEKAQTNIGNGQQMGGGGLQQQSLPNQSEHDELIRLREEVKYLKQQLADRDNIINTKQEMIDLLKSTQK